MSTTELYRVEATMGAVSRGIGSEHDTDHVQALALSSIYNQLGAALIHLDCHRNGTNKRLVKELLAADLLKLNVCTSRDSWDVADAAVEWWLNKNCPYCKGAGCDFNQVQCPACDGTGEKAKPSQLYRPLGIMGAALDWMEQQLRKRLANYVETPKRASHDAAGVMGGLSVYGWVTPRRSEAA